MREPAGMLGRTSVHKAANKGTGRFRTRPQAAPCFPFFFHSAEVPSVPSGANPRVGGRQSRASSFPRKGNSEAKTGSHLYLQCVTLISRGTGQPTRQPAKQSTRQPTGQPTRQPTRQPPGSHRSSQQRLTITNSAVAAVETSEPNSRKLS